MHLGIDGLGEGSIIGTGASAVVYRATQLDLGREVAVKILSATDPAFIRRFKREAKTLGRLSRSPGIVTVFDSGVTESGQPYLLLELCEASMLDRLQKHGPLDPIEVCEVAAQVAGAVAEAHEMGVVHRDMKPANVLTLGDRYLVTDFGISTVSGTTTGQTSSIGFTAGYVAPETIAGARVGSPADVYGLGATMFHLLTGETPFVDPTGEANLLALVQRVTNDSLPDLRLRGIPDAVCETVEWTMEKKPEDRPTALRLQTRLEAIVAGDTIKRRNPSVKLLPESPAAITGSTPVVAVPPPGDFAAQPPPPTAASLSPSAASPAPPAPPAAAPSPAGAAPVVSGLEPALSGSPPPTGLADGFAANGGSADAVTINRGPVDGAPVDRAATTTSILGQPSEARAPVVERQEFFVEPEPSITGRMVAAAVVAFLVGLGGVGAWLLSSGDEEANPGSGEIVAGPSTTARQAAGDQGTPTGFGSPSGSLAELRSAFEPVDVLDVVGQDQSEAVEALEDAGFEVSVVRRESTRQRGTVLSQDPPAGERAPFASTITIFVAVPEPPPSVTTASTMPSLVGKTRQAAEAELAAAGFTFEVSTVASLTDAGSVIRTVPAAGAPIESGSSISLVVSTGPPCELPNLAGMTVAQIDAPLRTAGCPAATITRISSELPAGTVIGVDFAESTPGGGVSVVAKVAEASETCSFDLVGMTEAAATAAITDGGCTAGAVTYQPSTEQNAGKVISSTVAGEVVSLVVGVPSCDVPPVAGLTVTAARAAIRSAGCDGTISVDPPASPAGSIVESVNPGAGTSIDISAAITLTVGSPPPVDCFVPDVVGLSVAAARAAIPEACPVVIRRQEVEADDPRIGTVTLQSVSGSVDAGTNVVLTVAVEEPEPSPTVTPPTVTTPTVTVPTITTPTITLPTITVPTSPTVPPTDEVLP